MPITFFCFSFCFVTRSYHATLWAWNAQKYAWIKGIYHCAHPVYPSFEIDWLEFCVRWLSDITLLCFVGLFCFLFCLFVLLCFKIYFYFMSFPCIYVNSLCVYLVSMEARIGCWFIAAWGPASRQTRAQKESKASAYTKTFLSERVRVKDSHTLLVVSFRPFLYSSFCIFYSLFFFSP